MNTWESIYVAETIRATVIYLRSLGMEIKYDPDSPTNKVYPEHDNAVMVGKIGLISSCQRWRRDPNPLNITHIPELAMACVQLRTDHPEYEKTRARVVAGLTVQPLLVQLVWRNSI